MTRYAKLTTDFITKVKAANHNLNGIFFINNKGNKALNGKKKAVIMVRKEIEYLKEVGKKDGKGYSATSIKSIITNYNKELKKNGLDIYCNIIKYVFSNDYSRINDNYSKKLKHRKNNMITINNGSELIDMCKNWLSSYDYIELTLGLAVLTGRRTAEILHTGKFSFVDDRHLLFKGQTKQRNNGGLGYEIPVLADSKEILKAINTLRILKKYKSIKEVNIKASSALSKAMKANFKKFHKKLKVHDLRRIYAYVCYHYEFCDDVNKDGRQDIDAYIMKILGHRITKSGESYKTIGVFM